MPNQAKGEASERGHLMTVRMGWCKVCRERGEWISTIRYSSTTKAWRHVDDYSNTISRDHEPDVVEYGRAPSIVAQQQRDEQRQRELAYIHETHPIDCGCTACDTDDDGGLAAVQ